MKQKLLTSALFLLGVSTCLAQSNIGAISAYTQNVNAERFNAKVVRSQEPMKADMQGVALRTAIPVHKSVSEETTPTARYTQPYGVFKVGLSPEMYNFPYSALIGPAYTTMTWLNLSPAESEGFRWEYLSDKDYETMLTSFDPLLKTTYGYAQVPLPSLVAIIGGVESEPFTLPYTFIQTGGRPSLLAEEGSTERIYFGACNYDLQDNGVYNSPLYNSYYFGIDGHMSAEWSDILQETVDCRSVLEYFEKPEHSYALSSVYMLCAVKSLDPATVITANVYAIKDDGTIGDIIATGSISAADVVVEPDQWSTIEIPFTTLIGGVPVEYPVTIDSAIFVEFVGFNLDTDAVYPAMFMTSDKSKIVGCTYQGFYEDGKLASFASWSGLAFGEDETNLSYCSGGLITLGLTYTWLAEKNNDYKLDASREGGWKTFNLYSYYSSDLWTMEDSNNALNDWVVPTTTYDETTGEATLTFTISELPADVEERSTDVTVSIPGSSVVFTITQNTTNSGIDDVVDPAVVVTVESGNFVVNGSSASSVDVYNIAGQRVASAAIQGETVIDGQNLAKGVYILKFNNNKTVKIVK